MRPPPYLTAGLPGTGGRIKLDPLDFEVVELPAYEPCGEGPHVFLTVARVGRTTREVACDLARLFAVPEREVGVAGLKDKRARTVQRFSLPIERGGADEVRARVEGELGLEVLAAARHGNKLRRGHLAGNRFRVAIRGTADEPGAPRALDLARAVAAELDRRGLANFFGPQRFGAGGDNARRGRALLEARDARRGRSWFGRLALSAWQAELYNRWLAERVARGDFERLVEGDVAKKLDTGGMFVVADAATEAPRLAARAITYTGPIYGARMRAAAGAAGEVERALFEAEGVAPEALRALRLDGSRRAGRVFAAELSVEPIEGGIELCFALPKGSYATVLLREVTKDDAPDAADDGAGASEADDGEDG